MDHAPDAMWRRDATGALAPGQRSYLANVEATTLEAARLIEGMDAPNAPLPEAGKPTRERRAIVVAGARRAVGYRSRGPGRSDLCLCSGCD